MDEYIHTHTRYVFGICHINEEISQSYAIFRILVAALAFLICKDYKINANYKVRKYFWPVREICSKMLI